MTRNEFNALCLKYLIDPAIALEDSGLVELLKTKQYGKVEQYLLECF